MLKMQTYHLVLRKAYIMVYFNDILESNFSVNDTCTWVHVKPTGLESLGI